MVSLNSQGTSRIDFSIGLPRCLELTTIEPEVLGLFFESSELSTSFVDGVAILGRRHKIFLKLVLLMRYQMHPNEDRQVC